MFVSKILDVAVNTTGTAHDVQTTRDVVGVQVVITGTCTCAIQISADGGTTWGQVDTGTASRIVNIAKGPKIRAVTTGMTGATCKVYVIQ